ncbi:uncharacterized protein BXZ73DRAFT_95307 [Epithele typhae]|uniref:uncharacterized protein n=1 Tax=Epithele typhae TaxID=378194 RepID=UPI0020078743|nr:uncharacterized protein BXZ73DRAFT_95307 [Epithele typhae]KAH9945783.1 hypothetical protein BXZ73DRAFT_95307 [Epithele typhae]
MSQLKITLRPPPNVDFVQGYPGIPPGNPDRPQAAVKGAIEVRVGQQGVKAKWVRIELRKVETLPGGGVANTFFDFVGQSPINLWTSPNDDYSPLHTNDLNFSIRIPESIPPTIALEKGAGIKYELIASVCVQGKKGFLRRDKPTISATAQTIIIDKHELHSTWPIYSQPETRNHSQDGVTLIIERAHTCYGPGDRIQVMATVKSDTLHTVVLRGFEFTLRETTVFRAAPHTQGKKGGPQVKVSSIGEHKVPVNVTLYGGTQHRAELSLAVPIHHTSATINAARHIDINYVLTVKALMGTGQPISMDLPIMISNWPRAVSVEAMRRIGHAFNVSLPNQQHHTAPAAQPQSAPLQQPQAHSISTPIVIHNASSIDSRPGQSLNQFSTAPANMSTRAGGADELGMRKKSIDAPLQNIQTIGATGYQRPRAGSGTSSGDHGSPGTGVTRPRSSGRGASQVQRPLTIVNLNEDELREQAQLAAAERSRRQPSTILESPVALEPPQQLPRAVAAPRGTVPSQFPSAEEEKERLYNRAVQGVHRLQGRGPPDSATISANSDTSSVKSPGAAPASSTSTTHAQWPSAEVEKALYRQAQEAVARAHGRETSEPTAATTSSQPSGEGSGRSPGMSAGAALYSEAMASINRNPSIQQSSSSGSGPAPLSINPASPITSPSPNSARQSGPPTSAADEKAMLARYYEAKHAVWQTQSAHYGRVPGNAEPVPYDALYPNQQGSSGLQSPQQSSPSPTPVHSPAPAQSPTPVTTPSSVQSPGGVPPSFAASGSSIHPILSEKERLRRHFEEQDAASQRAQQPQQPIPASQPWNPAPPAEDYASRLLLAHTPFSLQRRTARSA